MPTFTTNQTNNATCALLPREFVLWGLLLTVATVVAYLPVVHNGFVNYDDQVYITENPHIREGFTRESLGWLLTTTRGGNWHPLVWLSILTDVEMYGLNNAGGHHATNLVLHVLSTLLLFLALGLMTKRPLASAMVAGLFALHPLHVESVAWAAERKDTLSAFFWMLTLVGYAWYVRKPGWKRYTCVTLAFAGGLLSKSLLVTLPCVLLLLDVWPLKRLALPGTPSWSWQTARGLLLEKAPWLCMAGILAGVTVFAQQSVGAVAKRSAMGMDVRVENAVVSYMMYLVKMIWPTRLQVFYPHPLAGIPWWQVAVGALVLIGFTCAAWKWRTRFPYLGVGWLWYVGTLVPMIGLVQVGEQAMADRYTYIPLVGIFLAVVWGISDLLHQKQALAVLGSVVLVACGACTWRQIGHWKSTETLFRHALTVNPDNYLAHGNLAAELAAHDDFKGAIEHFQEVLRIKPKDAGAMSGMGAAYYKLGDEQRAIELYDAALKRQPHHTETHVNYGTALLNRGDWRGALEHYEASLPKEEENPVVHYGLAEALKELGREEDAMVHIRRALELDPDYAEAYNTLGILLRRKGETQQAAAAYERALELKPEQGEVYHNLALLAEGRGDSVKAKALYEEALAHGYESERLHFNLANLLQREKALPEAIAHYQAALKLNQAYQPAWVNLGVALTSAGKLQEAYLCFQQALRLKPDDAGAHNGYGAALYYGQNFAEAAVQFQAALTLSPNYPGASDNLARAQAQLKATEHRQ